MTSNRLFEILLVEDNATDIQLTREALRELGLNHRLHVAFDGEQALARLRDTLKNGEPLPDLMLLDLNMPRGNGREVLTAIKQDPRMSAMPVLMLSTSYAERDITDCYRLHANSYLVKPLDFGVFVNLMRSTCDYWLAQVTLPPRRSDPQTALP